MILTNLMTYMVVLTLSGDIPTNTPAFQAATLQTMTTNAQFFADKLGLVGSRFTTNAAKPDLIPQPVGFKGSVAFDSRYVFRALNGRFNGFGDKLYWNRRFQTSNVTTNQGVLEEWAAATNRLTMTSAREIAVHAMDSLGLIPQKTGFPVKPTLEKQWGYDEDRKLKLPYYTFEWESKGAACRIDVSGISSNVVLMEVSGPFLYLNNPTNRLDLLGLPPNTVFVRKHFTRPGQPQTYEVYDPNGP